LADSTVTFDLESPAGGWEAPAETVVVSAVDEALLAGLREGVEGAYEELIDRFQQPVYNLVFRLVANPNDTADVVQEVFLKVFRNVGSFRAESSLKTWVYRIAVNEARNQRRWFTRHAAAETCLEDDHSDGLSYDQTVADNGRSPYQLTLDNETRGLIEAAVRELKPVFRTAVVLRDVEGMSYDEIAEILGISLGTVKSRILRGREVLRRKLAGRLERSPTILTPAHSA